MRAKRKTSWKISTGSLTRKDPEGSIFQLLINTLAVAANIPGPRPHQKELARIARANALTIGLVAGESIEIAPAAATKSAARRYLNRVFIS